MVNIRLLGGFELWVEDEREKRLSLRHLPYQRAKALLALLLMEPKAHSREILAYRLWPNNTTSEALSLLRRMLHVLKTTLDTHADLLEIRRTQVRWVGAVECDAWTLAQWQAVPSLTYLPSAEHVQTWQRLFASYRGAFLEGVEIHSTEFEHWVQHHRLLLQQQALRLGLCLARTHHRQGKLDAAIHVLHQLLHLDPVHEAALSQLLQIRSQQDQKSTGLAEWEQFATAYKRLLDLPPPLALQALARSLETEPLAPPSAAYLPDKISLTVVHLRYVQDHTLSPEQQWDALSCWRSEQAQKLHHLGAHVLQAPTAGLSACFGYPIPQETACEQAVIAALDVVNAETAVGAAWGWVLVSPRDSTQSPSQLSPHHWPDIGFTVTHEAQQYAFHADAGQVLVSKTVHDTVLAQFDWMPHPGSFIPLSFRNRTAHSTEKDPHLFLGRDTALAWVTAHAQACFHHQGDSDSRPYWVLLEAEAGMGKSHLVQHWLNQAATGDLQTFPSAIHYTFIQARQAWAYSPFKALETTWNQASVPAQEAVSASALRESWVRHLSASLITPSLWVIEDAHWLDPSSLDALHSFIQSGPHAHPCFLILTARPEHSLPISPSQVYCLTPLDRAVLEQMTQHMAPKWRQPERDQVIEQCRGNPLYLKALLATPFPSKQIPTRLIDALQAQIHPVGPMRTIGEWAALLGVKFKSADLRCLLDHPDICTTALMELQECGLIHPEEDEQYRFHHALQCEALLAGVHRNRLMEMHARVLDRLYAHADPSMPDADHAQLAQRNENAGRLLAAQSWRKAALTHAQRRHAFAEVSHHAQSLVSLIRQTGGGVASVELFEALMCLASAQAVLLGYGASAAQATYGQALKEALRLKQVDAEFAATWALWLGSSSASGYNYSYQLACRLQTLADHRHEQHQAMAAYALGNTLVCLGRFQEAVECLRQLPTPVWYPLPEMPDDAVAHGLVFLALAEWMSGHPVQARQAAAHALGRARRGAQPSTLGFVLSLVALLHTLGHDWPVVARLGKKITHIGQTHELALWQAAGALMCEASAVAQGHPEVWTSLETTVLGLAHIMSGVEGFFLTVLVNAGVHSESWNRLGPWIERGLMLSTQRQDHFFEMGFLHARLLCEFQGKPPPSKWAQLQAQAQ